jgi:outer membrane protein OmpA-like peptidoglycan-associated protein
VEAVQMDGLTDSDRMELDRLTADLEGLRILFETSSAAIAPSQQPVLDALSAGLREALRLGAEVGLEVRAQILGGSDQSGPEQTNARLRRQRAEAVRGRLLEMGAPAAALSVQSADGDLGDSPERRRSVAVKLQMQEAPARM